MSYHKSFLIACATLAVALTEGNCQSTFAQDPTAYCNAVQSRNAFIRYPLGTIGVWSTPTGEMADVMTRVPKIYPCVNSVVIKQDKDDWRSTITGDPSVLRIEYKADKPSGATKTAITVAPHVSVFQVSFPEGTKTNYLVFHFTSTNVDSWAGLQKWTDRRVTQVDSQTLQASVGQPDQKHAYYLIKFSTPCTGVGTFDASGTITPGASSVTGPRLGLYASFAGPTVTVAVSESFTSAAKAQEFMRDEYKDFGSVQQKCLAAWKDVLDRFEIDGVENSKRMAYTALYTMYANIIDGSDGSCYLPYYPRPRTVASSAYWQFIGGYQSCCFDNVRVVYPFLMLTDPELMTDVLGTYLARYQRDHCMHGDICLFTGPQGSKQNIRFTPLLVDAGYNTGVKADYPQLYAGLKDNYTDPKYEPAKVAERGYMTQPKEGGFACSRTLEYASSFESMGLLAKANHEDAAFAQFARLSTCYTNLWDSEHKFFRLKNADGTWGPFEMKKMTWNPNPQGLFEGSSIDYMFHVPHDPYGLLALPGSADGFVQRVTDYCLNETWFNDYQYHYPLLLYYADAANQAQKIMRQTWIPFFKSCVMYEGISGKPPRNGWQDHYTSNSGWLLCSMLGLYPVPTPPGQFILCSPALTHATIHLGSKNLTVNAPNTSTNNIYVKSIKLDGKPYPAYMIPAKRLASGATIDFEMGSDSAEGLGSLYIASTDGFVRDAELASPTLLKCTIEALGSAATTRIHSPNKPTKVLRNGQEDSSVSYDPLHNNLSIHSSGTAAIEVMVQ
jgi:predicted alpha-1,2-mannosidase